MGTPKQLYSDREGGLQSNEMTKFLNGKIVKLVTTMFAQGVERFNDTENQTGNKDESNGNRRSRPLGRTARE